MIDQLTLGDLLRVGAWAGFGALPLVAAYAMGMEPEKKSEGDRALLFYGCLAFQIGFGVAAYIAGGKQG